MNYYDSLFEPYNDQQYRCPYVDADGDIIRNNYYEPADAVWEIICNLYHSNVLVEDDLRADMAYLCSYYGLDDALLYQDQCSVVGALDVYGPLTMTWYAEVRDAVRALRDKLYHRKELCTREDIRPILAYICVHLMIETDYLEEQEVS